MTLLLLLCGCLTAFSQLVPTRESWGAACHADAYMGPITMREAQKDLTMLFDDPEAVTALYFSRDENCGWRTMTTTIHRTHDHAVLVEFTGERPEEAADLYVCTVPPMEMHLQRLLKYDDSSKHLPKFEIVAYITCICFSFLFSGLNLALLSLDVETLVMIRNYDEDPSMRKYAEDIIPIRKDTNLMICTIILGNTLCNVISTLIFADLTGGLELDPWPHAFAVVIGPTIILLIFGEITPQIICSKYALPIGSRLKMIMHFLTFITLPLSKPLSWALNFLVGTEKLKSSTVRKIVRFAVRKDDMAMIANNTLELRKKLAKDVMTPLSQVKMLNDTDIVNKKLRSAAKMGHTRMPVCTQGDPYNIIGVLNVKDLYLLDHTFDLVTVGTVLQLWPRQSSCRFVACDTPMPQLMKTLRTHAIMVIVTEYSRSEARNVPTGIVTLEDLLEEIIGEIYDEKDRQKMTGDERDTKKEEKPKKERWRKMDKKTTTAGTSNRNGGRSRMFGKKRK